MTYAEKLLDPRWQKKRLSILDRDNWRCKLCGDGTTTFHIHHKKYKGDPWEVEDEDLVTYCKHCHSVVEFNKSETNFTPIKVVKSELDDETRQLHLIYLDGSADKQIDIYWYDKNGKLEFRGNLSDCTLWFINQYVFDKAEAP